MTFFLIKNYYKSQVTTFRILDIGCADGYYSNEFLTIKEINNISYMGTDISETVIKRANIKFSKENISFQKDDIRTLLCWV